MACSHVHVCLWATCLYVSVVFIGPRGVYGESSKTLKSKIFPVPGFASPENDGKNKREGQTMGIQVLHLLDFYIPTAEEYRTVTWKNST